MALPATTPEFDQLYTSQASVIKQNYDYRKAFYRSVKVVLISYPEYSETSPSSYQSIDLFIREMQRLYDVQQIDQNLIDEQNKKMKSEEIMIIVTVKRFRGRDELTNPRIVLRRQTKSSTYNLDPNKEIQTMNPIRLSLKFDAFKSLRTDPTEQLVFSIEGNTWKHPQQRLNDLKISICGTNPEGYEQWFDFGRGVELLINIEFRVKNEPNITAEEVSNFHLHTIYKMLERRLLLQTTRPKWSELGHRMGTFKAKVTHLRSLADPQKNEMFWTTPPAIDLTRPQRLPKTVKFIDFQTGWKCNEDFEDGVCLCSEWCNWNAFFYYNPIYRFLLVRHNQLYLEGKTTLPNMYLNVSVMLGCRAFPGKVPILHLMNNANDYRMKYYENYFLKIPNFKQEYESSIPSGAEMDAISYRILKNELDVIKLCHELDDNPFADICIEALLSYFKVLTDLHTNLGLQTQYVTDQWEWYEELEKIGRNKYGIYIRQSYVKLMRDDYPLIVTYDWLFTTDYEYSSRLAKTDDEIEIKSMRDKVLKRTSIDSPFNIRLVLNNFLNTFASIYKFLLRVEPRLPSAHTIETLEVMCDCYLKLDEDFEAYRQSNILIYQIESIDPQFQAMQQNFKAFYTLKLYFYLFEIQKHCINKMLEKNEEQEDYANQVCDQFSFIWRHSMVERNYLSAYPEQPLFEISSNFEQSFDDFYNYWGKADHETQPTVNITQNVNSGHFQFERLYYWWRNNGNGKKKFKKIVDQFIECQKNSINCSKTMIEILIMPSIVVLSNSYRFHVEVFDQLVYYAVKANCSVILSTTSKLFKKMHSLQIQTLVQRNTSYSLCKPGWVPLFRTMHSVLNTIDRLNNKYIIFDDEFERISNTCLQTKQMIKNIYRQFYNKLSMEWIKEIKNTLTRTIRTSDNKTVDFIQMLLAVGQAFICAFVDNFRFSFDQHRKTCWSLLNRYANSPGKLSAPQRHFIDCKTVYQAYFCDRNLMRNAMPFQSNPWRQHLAAVIAHMDQLPPDHFQIDLNVADI